MTPGRVDSIANKTLRKLSQETFETFDFVGFTSRPMSEIIGIIRRKSSQTLFTGPPIVASSKYQMLMGDLTVLVDHPVERQFQRGLSHYQSQDGFSWRTLSMLNEDMMGLLMNKLQGNDLVSQY